MVNTEDIEQLSIEIHKLYCTQYEKDHGEPYWTKGDYSLLEERVKEYDRNIARFILARESSFTEKVLGEIGEDVYPTFKLDNVTEYTAEMLRFGGMNEEKKRLREVITRLNKE